MEFRQAGSSLWTGWYSYRQILKSGWTRCRAGGDSFETFGVGYLRNVNDDISRRLGLSVKAPTRNSS